jgi:hypothetical protein
MVTSESADHTRRHGVAQAEGLANGEDGLANSRVNLAKFDWLGPPVGCLDF